VRLYDNSKLIVELYRKGCVFYMLVVILIIGLAGIIGNQYSSMRRMEGIQRSLDDINQKLRDMNNSNNNRY